MATLVPIAPGTHEVMLSTADILTFAFDHPNPFVIDDPVSLCSISTGTSVH